MESDASVIIVNSVLILGIVLALYFSSKVEQLNRRLAEKNRAEREQLDQEFRLD